MKRLLQFMLGAGMCATAMAIPAKPGFVTFTQPDGTQVEVRIVGDEHGHITYSRDGLVLVNVDDYLEYARFDASGRPQPSGLRVGRTRLGAEEAGRLQSAAQIERWAEMMTSSREARLALPKPAYVGVDTERVVPLNYGRCTSSFPVLGEQKGLVILVEYDDVEFKYGDYDYFNRMLNEEGFSDHGSLGSAKDWFVQNSGGKFIPDFDVYGPVKLPKKRSYYGGNDAYGNDKNPHMMAIHACDSLDNEVDFSQYDRDGDGKIDNVFIFYAGKGEHDSNVANAVWPHSWDVSLANADTTYVYDGVVLDHYACTCEYPSGYSRPDGIGTFVHEFSHVMGLPDLYVTTYTGGFTPGPWSVLDNGPYNNDRLTPPNYSSFEKCALGWVEMQPMEEGTLELTDFSDSNFAYVLPTERKEEFYFFENRQQTGNDAFLPYHGMLVWRVDYKKSVWDNNKVNNTSSHQRVDLIEADNKKSESTRDGDPFPGTAGVTEFTFETTPSLSSWKNKALAFDIKNIEETPEGVIRFDAVAREDDTPDSVGEIDTDEAPDVYFDLMGRRVENPSAGIYVAGGRKVVVK